MFLSWIKYKHDDTTTKAIHDDEDTTEAIDDDEDSTEAIDDDTTDTASDLSSIIPGIRWDVPADLESNTQIATLSFVWNMDLMKIYTNTLLLLLLSVGI